jgi:hypothetical protein
LPWFYSPFHSSWILQRYSVAIVECIELKKIHVKRKIGERGLLPDHDRDSRRHEEQLLRPGRDVKTIGAQERVRESRDFRGDAAMVRGAARFLS